MAVTKCDGDNNGKTSDRGYTNSVEDDSERFDNNSTSKGSYSSCLNVVDDSEI